MFKLNSSTRSAGPVSVDAAPKGESTYARLQRLFFGLSLQLVGLSTGSNPVFGRTLNELAPESRHFKAAGRGAPVFQELAEQAAKEPISTTDAEKGRENNTNVISLADYRPRTTSSNPNNTTTSGAGSTNASAEASYPAPQKRPAAKLDPEVLAQLQEALTNNNSNRNGPPKP